MPRTPPYRFNRNWVATLPLPAYFGVVTVIYGVLTWTFDALGNSRHATWANLVLHVVIGSLFGAGMTAVVAFQRRRLGGSTLMAATASAVRSGHAPAGADPSSWTPIIERRLRTMTRSRWSSPVLMAPILVFAAVAWALVPATAGPALWLIGVSLVVVALSEVQAARYIPRARAVMEQLQAGPAGPAAPDSPVTSTDGTRPWTVVLALIGCAIALSGVAINFAIFVLTPGDVTDAARRVSADGGISLARAEQLAGVAVAIVTTYWSVLLLALAVFGWWAFRGRNRGRALLVPTALLTLIELIAHRPISVAVSAAAILAVVLLYLPVSNTFFAARKGRRRSA